MSVGGTAALPPLSKAPSLDEKAFEEFDALVATLDAQTWQRLGLGVANNVNANATVHAAQLEAHAESEAPANAEQNVIDDASLSQSTEYDFPEFDEILMNDEMYARLREQEQRVIEAFSNGRTASEDARTGDQPSMSSRSPPTDIRAPGTEQRSGTLNATHAAEVRAALVARMMTSQPSRRQFDSDSFFQAPNLTSGSSAVSGIPLQLANPALQMTPITGSLTARGPALPLSSREDARNPKPAGSEHSRKRSRSPSEGPNRSGGSQSRVSKHRKRYEEDLTCPICHELFAVPHSVIPCSHSFCAACVHAWWADKDEHTCPTCRTVLSDEVLSVPVLALSNIVASYVEDLATLDAAWRKSNGSEWVKWSARVQEWKFKHSTSSSLEHFFRDESALNSFNTITDDDLND